VCAVSWSIVKGIVFEREHSLSSYPQEQQHQQQSETSHEVSNNGATFQLEANHHNVLKWKQAAR